jgi:6-phosphogluconolactonase
MAVWTGLVPTFMVIHLGFMSTDAQAAENRIYIGTYTGRGTSRGVYTATLDPGTGKLSAPELAAEAANPSFLALHPTKRFLYAVGEMDTFEGKRGGAISAYAIGPNGKLSFLNSKASQGTGPCHLSVDATGRWVLVANYGSGSVAAFGSRA